MVNGFSCGVTSCQSEAESRVNRFDASGEKRESIDFFRSSLPKESSWARETAFRLEIRAACRAEL
mgnify:CR=1 FL=1